MCVWMHIRLFLSPLLFLMYIFNHTGDSSNPSIPGLGGRSGGSRGSVRGLNCKSAAFCWRPSLLLLHSCDNEESVQGQIDRSTRSLVGAEGRGRPGRGGRREIKGVPWWWRSWRKFLKDNEDVMHIVGDYLSLLAGVRSELSGNDTCKGWGYSEFSRYNPAITGRHIFLSCYALHVKLSSILLLYIDGFLGEFSSSQLLYAKWAVTKNLIWLSFVFKAKLQIYQ